MQHGSYLECPLANIQNVEQDMKIRLKIDLLWKVKIRIKWENRLGKDNCGKGSN